MFGHYDMNSKEKGRIINWDPINTYKNHSEYSSLPVKNFIIAFNAIMNTVNSTHKDNIFL